MALHYGWQTSWVSGLNRRWVPNTWSPSACPALPFKVPSRLFRAWQQARRSRRCMAEWYLQTARSPFDSSSGISGTVRPRKLLVHDERGTRYSTWQEFQTPEIMTGSREHDHLLRGSMYQIYSFSSPLPHCVVCRRVPGPETPSKQT